jgi:hypothetical protein
MPLPFTRTMPRFFDLSVLTKLSLFDCNLSLLLDDLAPAVEVTNLTHFECSTRDMVAVDHTEVLQDFFERNTRLEHLRLSLCLLADLPMRSPHPANEEEESAEEVLIWPLRGKLRTLSWHDSQPTQFTEGPFNWQKGFLYSQSLEWICQEFPKLRQLGFKAPESTGITITGTKKWRDQLLDYLVS